MIRDEAFALLVRHLSDRATQSHCLACEACMRALAVRFGEDVELWGVAGLVHDIDLDACGEDRSRHAILGAEILRDAGAEEEIVDAVLGHAGKAPRVSRLSKALWVVDPTTGFITAAALIRPSRNLDGLEVSSVKKRMKDKRFAAAVDRDRIAACESEIGLTLDEHLAVCLEAMRGARELLSL